MAKGTPTKTTNPIHFEDLDPKRFEDLVRELIYDFKDWQSIESTGKSGADDGFDIRAYERLGETVLSEDGVETVHPMDGNLWMIQCKREKQIGPKKLKSILNDVDPKNPPYGYILAASVSFSKKSYDAFREELKSKGVLEFYLWGKPDLEAQLHLPKNDRILFTFFGVSNVSRKRSRATEIRFGVTNKNRIMRAFGDSPEYKTVLVRDSKDREYPYPKAYPDFDQRPRWKEYDVVDYHPLGLILKVRKYFAFYDRDGKSYDFADVASLIFRESDDDETRNEQQKQLELVRDYWETLPRKNQAEYHLNGMIRYDAMLVVDDKGDNWNAFPHLFVDFVGDNGPFYGYFEYLEIGHHHLPTNDLKEIDRFPTKFPEPKFGKIHDAEPLMIPDNLAERLLNYQTESNTLYDLDGSFDHLSERDVAFVHKEGQKKDYLQVTYRYQTSVGNLLKDHPHLMWEIEQFAGRKPGKKENISVIEVRRVYERQFDTQDS